MRKSNISKNSRTLEELLDECLQNNDEAGFDKLFDRYCKIAAWKAEGTKQDYDLTFPNICVQGEIWTMIDYEWTTDKLTPQQIISRALNCYGQEDPVRLEHPIVKKHLEALGIGKEQMRELSEKELAFQRFVLQEKGRAEPDGSWAASASDRQSCCAVSGIFRPGGSQKGAGI